MNTNLQAIILAAGKSSRFKTNSSKLLEKICGQEMILYVTNLLEHFNAQTTLVVGYQKEMVESLVQANHANANFVYQQEQLGTGHALMCTKELWNQDHILVLNGDVPLITKEIIESLYQKHITQNSEITFVVAHNIDPELNSYGRVIQEGSKVRIVEAKDDNRENSEHCCINAGIYLFKREFLEKNIQELSPSKVTGELYITDLINIASKKGFKVETVSAQVDRIRGINTLQELWSAEQIKRSEIVKNWMQHGVRFSFAQNTHVDLYAQIGAGTTIGSATQIYGNTKIGNNCKIEAFCILDNAVIEDNVIVRSHSVIKDSKVSQDATVGPFVHLNNSNSENLNETDYKMSLQNETMFMESTESFVTAKIVEDLTEVYD